MKKPKLDVQYGWKHGACYHEAFDNLSAASERVKELVAQGWQDASIKVDTTPNPKRLIAALQAGRA